MPLPRDVDYPPPHRSGWRPSPGPDWTFGEKVATIIGCILLLLGAALFLVGRSVTVLGITGSCGSALAWALESQAQRSTRVFCGPILAAGEAKAILALVAGAILTAGALIRHRERVRPPGAARPRPPSPPLPPDLT